MRESLLWDLFLVRTSRAWDWDGQNIHFCYVSDMKISSTQFVVRPVIKSVKDLEAWRDIQQLAKNKKSIFSLLRDQVSAPEVTNWHFRFFWHPEIWWKLFWSNLWLFFFLSQFVWRMENSKMRKKRNLDLEAHANFRFRISSFSRMLYSSIKLTQLTWHLRLQNLCRAWLFEIGCKPK